jgi:hypothetical protein
MICIVNLYKSIFFLDEKIGIDLGNQAENLLNKVLFIKIQTELVFIDKKCIFAPLINRGRVPQNLIIRLCQ